MKIILTETQLKRVEAKLNEVEVRKKRMLGRGTERKVYPSTTNPNLVFKVGEYEQFVREKQIFDAHPDIYVKIHDIKKYNNPRVGYRTWDPYVGVAIMDRVNTKSFLLRYNKLELALKKLNIRFSFGKGSFISIISLIDELTDKNTHTQYTPEINENTYGEIVDKLNEYQPSIADFFIKLCDCVGGVIQTLDFPFDSHVRQFGLDKEGNIKCFDI
jgi:hypothetical protein